MSSSTSSPAAAPVAAPVLWVVVATRLPALAPMGFFRLVPGVVHALLGWS